MPKRIVVQTVLLTRDGQTVRPPIGKPFDFTDAELKQINALTPDALAKIINNGDAAQAETVELTQAELDQRVQEELQKQREQMEKDLRAQIEAEQAAKSEGSTDTSSAKTTKSSTSKKGDDKPADDEI